MTRNERLQQYYSALPAKMEKAREHFGRPLTLTEKILFAHLHQEQEIDKNPKKRVVSFSPDRVAMQDATAQMALLQFMSSGIPKVKAPSSVHCDHLIRAHTGAAEDLAVAENENKEVYDFLHTASQKYGIGFWKPGAGIIHQVVLENYAFPGGMMIGTDSHTPNAGGLGMVAIGIGGADAVDVMVGQPFGLSWPGVIGVHLKGKLNGWTSAKDVILKVCETLTVKGGTGHIVEYFGEGTSSISCTGKATICNMGAEHGATTSLFPYDEKMAAYLNATGREEWANMANNVAEHLRPDEDVQKNPQKYYDRILEIDLSTLEPHVVGPHSPDKSRSISKLATEAEKEGYPDKVSYALIGSCTNSSYEDLDRVAHIAKNALEQGLTLRTPLVITPGSEQVLNTITRDGQMAIFQDLGITILANACGPCIGQWQRDDIKKGEKNTIISSFNRNFRARNDANPETLSFIGSPESVIALALAGSLSFNPKTDKLTNKEGKTVSLNEPVGDELPKAGFDMKISGYVAPASETGKIDVNINPQSERLQVLEPFSPWDGKDFIDLAILVKAKGKCTTDHISPAGPWLKFRGHLNNISDNMLTGATNAYTDKIGTGLNQLTKETDQELSKIARSYKAKNLGWVVVGDENYGEGSSREHAAMEPRYLGGKAVIVKSFARIHETNLKKQGVLPLVLANADDYNKFGEKDRVSVLGLKDLAPEKPLVVKIDHENNTSDEITVKHTLTLDQIEWFKAGSALNKISNDTKK